MHARAVRATLIAIVTAVLGSAGIAEAAPTQVTVRIEGKAKTLFEGPVLTDGHAVQSASDTQPRTCDATNNGAHPTPGATPTAASVDAMTIIGDTFDADWYPGFDDYYLTRWGPDAEATSDLAWWGVLVNGAFTPVGGCQYADVAGDDVLWAWDAFSSKPFLRLARADDPLPAPGPTLATAFVDQGQPLAVELKSFTGAMDGAPETIQPVDKGVVEPVKTDPVKGYQEPLTADPSAATTNATGAVSIAFATPGWHRIKATKTGYIRSNRLDVCVRAPGASDCGPLPVDARVRSVTVPEPPPEDPPPGPGTQAPTPPGAGTPPSGGGTPPASTAPVRLSTPVVGEDRARGRIVVRWKVLDAGVGMRTFTIESQTGGGRRWTTRAQGTGSSAALKLPAGVSSRLRLTIVDALGRGTTRSLGEVVVPLDDRSGKLDYGRGWTPASDPGAWARTVTRGGSGAKVRVRLAAGRPLLFLRGVTRGAKVELTGGGKREVFRIAGNGATGSRVELSGSGKYEVFGIARSGATGARMELSGGGEYDVFRVAPSAATASRTVTGARRSKGMLTVRVLSGSVGLDGVALAP